MRNFTGFVMIYAIILQKNLVMKKAIVNFGN